MNCQFCGSKEHVQRLGADGGLLYGNEIVICEKCLKYAFYCASCKVVHVRGVVNPKIGKVCITCVETKKFCKHCGNNVKTLKEGFCSACYKKTATCAKCGDKHIHLYLTGEDGSLCSKCIQDYSPCAGCGVYHTTLDKKYHMCEDCLKNSHTCGICGAIKTQGHMTLFNKKLNYICKTHVRKCTCSCCKATPMDCITHVFSEDLFPSTRELNVCGSCHEEGLIGNIKKYQYKPQGIFRGDSLLFFGVENEVTFDPKVSPVKECAKLQLADPTEQHWYIKRDGSIPNGFETVTHPMTFDYIKTQFPLDLLFGTTEKFQHDKNCGMHVHMSKKAFTNAQLYKFLLFVNNNQGFMSTVAERDPNGYCPAVNKNTFIVKALEKSGRDRDQVNLIPQHTAEVRIFQGAITKEQYLKNIEFCYALFNFTKVMAIASLTQDRFVEYIQKEPVMYENLISFLTLKRLI